MAPSRKKQWTQKAAPQQQSEESQDSPTESRSALATLATALVKAEDEGDVIDPPAEVAAPLEASTSEGLFRQESIEGRLARQKAFSDKKVGEASSPKSPIKPSAGTGGLDSSPGRPAPQRFVRYTKDGFVHVYEKVGDVVFYLKVRASDSYVSLEAALMESYGRMRVVAEEFVANSQGRIVLVKGKVMDGLLNVKMQALTGYHCSKTRAIAGYGSAKAGVASGCMRVKTAALAVPIPAPVSSGFVYVQGKFDNITVSVQNGYLHIYATTADLMISMKAKGLASHELVRTRVLEILARVEDSVASYTSKVKGGLLSVKGKVDGVVVNIKARGTPLVESTKASTLKTYAHMKEVVRSWAITGKITDGMTCISGKANDVVVYVHDGYIHAVSKVGETTVVVKAKLGKVQGAVKVQILEAYASTEHLAQTLVQKVLSLSASQKVLSLADSTKARASQKPVAASALSGAVVVGAGSGAAGGVAGGLAGATFGMPMALFTFGLSVPFCAAVGGSAGACIGLATGGATGAVGGGALGYGYEHRVQIKGGVDTAMEKAVSGKDKLREVAVSSVARVKARVY